MCFLDFSTNIASISLVMITILYCSNFNYNVTVSPHRLLSENFTNVSVQYSF